MKILDCTIRDGGYYTNWDFDNNLITKYFLAMQKLPIDIVEIGYRSVPQKEYLGKYFYLPDFALDEIAGLAEKKALAIMLNEKDILPKDLDNLLNGLEGYISLIRLAVDPASFDRALKLGEAIRKKGFKIAFNLMYMSKYYQDKEFLSKLRELDGLVEYQVGVDSYGGMLPGQVKDLVTIMKTNCNEKVGFHGHNNLELAFANALSAIDAGCDLIDATVMGMGRGAGNLKTELLLTHLASIGVLDFDFNILSSLIETWTPLHKEYEWGTNLPYMVSGSNSLPQKDVMEWVTKRFYSYNSIIRALHNKMRQESDNFQLPIFTPQKTYKRIVVIGGGANAKHHAVAVKRFISRLSNVCVIHASSKNSNCYEDVNVDQFFCLVGNEGYRLEDVFSNLNNFSGQCILPPFPRKMGTYVPESVRNVSFELREVGFTDNYKDSHTALALQTALDLNAERIFLVGYDGYSDELITPKEQGLIKENEYCFSLINNLVKLESILPTKYSLNNSSVYSQIV